MDTFYFRLNGTRIDDESLIDLGTSLSSNSTLGVLRCVAIYTTFNENILAILMGSIILKGYGIFFRRGGGISSLD